MASRAQRAVVHANEGGATLRLDDAPWPRPYRVERRPWAPGLDQLLITADEASPDTIRRAVELRAKKDVWYSVEWAGGRVDRGPGRVASLTIESSAYRLAIIVATARPG